MQQPALLLMVKNPIAGKTKTRLAEDVGDDMALRMYRILLEHTRDEALRLEGVSRYLFYSEFVPQQDLWPAQDFVKLVQEGPGLGERMQHAFSHAFDGKHDRVIIIGSDCPGLTAELMQEAIDALEEYDIVLGPALDGGYYLLGMRQLHSSLFVDMQWSTPQVLRETVKRGREAGLTLKKLRPLSDVDHLEDWLGFGWPLPEGELPDED